MFILKIKAVLLKHFCRLRWYNVISLLVFYLVLSWGLMWLCGETALTQRTDFVYWVIVTASTVGYGDLSPTTDAGKYCVALFVIPMGLGLFGLIVGSVASAVGAFWRRGVKGLNSVEVSGHWLVIGWNQGRTLQLIRLLQREMAEHQDVKTIVLCVKEEIENPMPGEIEFVRVTDYADADALQRASVSAASCIIVDSDCDEVTMSAALLCSAQSPDAHIIAYFSKESLSNVLRAHCPNIECLPSVSVEMMAKSASDPGSSEVHYRLLSLDAGMTQYSLEYTGDKTQVRSVFLMLKEKFHATMIGVSRDRTDLQLNPALESDLSPGDVIHYIAERRIQVSDWSVASASSA